MRLLLVVLAAALFVSCHSSGLTVDGQGKRVLALLDNYGMRESHSTFFKSLKDRGFQVTFKAADDADLTIAKYGEYLFDHIALFCPNVVEFGGNVSSKAIVDFIDAGGNVLVATNAQIGEPIREIAGECGVEYSDDDAYVVDRFNTDANDDGLHTLVAVDTDTLVDSPVIVGSARKAGVPFLYRGAGLTSDQENPLLIDILTGSATSYTYNPSEAISEYPHAIGKSTVLASAMQARNNARVLFIGSLDFFSNEFFASSVQKGSSGKRWETSGNEQLAVALTKWTFKESGVLRVAGVKHSKVGEASPPAEYTINEQVTYTIRIEEMRDGKWKPFEAKDVQLEFVRLDPFVRTFLKATGGNFNAQYTIPDVYGIFKFVVDYNRVGYTHLFSSTQVSVRPYTHTQYERFIPTAYPYYASAFSMMLAVFFFSFIQLYHSDPSPSK